MAKPPTKAAAKKPRAKRPIKSDSSKKPEPKSTRRGTPKGKGVVVGRNGGRIGNPKFEPTDKQRAIVSTHAACGTRHSLIAHELGITEPTLRKYFDFELETGLERLNARIGSGIAQQALSGCRSSQRLWMLTRGGWSTKQISELVGAGGQPIQLAAPPRNADLKLLSTDELREYRRIQGKLEGVPEGGE